MKKIKLILSTMLISILTLMNIVNVNAQVSKLESGIYELQNDIYHEKEVGIAMSRSYTKEIMKLEKSKEGVFLTVSFTGTDYMEDYRIFVDGQQVDTEVVDENSEEKSISLKFKIDNLNQNIEAKIYVEPMGRDVEFEIIPKKDTINLIEEIEQETNISDMSKSSNNTTLIVVGLITIIAIIIFILKKTKK